jgi:hypothetical protein
VTDPESGELTWRPAEGGPAVTAEEWRQGGDVVAGEPVAGQPAGDEPLAGQPPSDEPVTGKPAGDEPVTGAPPEPLSEDGAATAPAVAAASDALEGREGAS